MKLFNKGHRKIDHAESNKPGAACVPYKVFTVSDELGAKLKKMYPKELENLDDATAKFNDPTPVAKAATAAAPGIDLLAETDAATLAEKEEADSLGVSVEDLRKLKAE
jgi:hypothetical protein